MASQRFCLRWNNHQSNLLSVFDQLLHAETFTDVTLAVEGQYLKAHKMVLSACSPYFNALFVNHPEKHPIVILKDVPYSDMKSLLDFMYRGEVSVDQERLTAFLRVAESLRIKGLTEVNDDKPVGAAPTPPPPQLHRIQPYLVQQRTKVQNMLNINDNQQSLLGSALSSMPKRKRGRPRKLSGSSNGTGNDFDEYDRDGMMHDSPKHEVKISGDGYSGNEGSDENQRESCDNDQDANDCTDSRDGRIKKRKSQSKDRINNDNDNSTSVHLNNSPELSQRLFGVNKPPPPPPTSMAPISCASSSSNLPVISAVQSIQSIAGSNTTAQKVSNSTQIIQISSVSPTNQTVQQQKQTVQTSAQTPIPEILDPATHLPTALGLKIRVHPASQQQQQQSNHHQQPKSNKSTSSMLQQQLCNDSLSNNNNNNKNNNSCQVAAAETKCNNHPSERRQSCNDSNTIQPPSSNNLHHQFLLHMATNPIVKTEYLINNEINNDENVMPIEVSSSPNSNSNAQNFKSETEGATPTIIDLVPSPTNANERPPKIEESSPPVTPRNQRPVQRRRIRRKAQSSMDDQAEHLTEMSVRGLDLFRYASITEGVYQCTECAKENVQKTFKNKYSFQRHAFLYHEGKHRKVFPCPVCGKEFSRPDKMKNHMKMTHEGFVPKDVAYHPLNYLITAAAAGEIQHLFHQIDQNNPEANSGDCTTSNQHPSKPQSLIKLKNEIHTIHEASPSPPPPLGTREGSIIATQEEVK
ncbi:protein tramtrack, alpha isoform isoform X1 [Eupeodes corollae]|uniref:protein tramtrack, alpha isoform isoform X1 n=1 Tax=Eupeodes corollae TaxID=290404 RepID=UPI002492698A|nr:protein tramtrack, alpha isoform isoform X1 [Eupeodes corollae]XP_055908661.1 protein tramtrack, alpha isoform isoform X1 [Eupeodes corollae]XP_055908662.1 protein tramtrack, alpha isoform isoform X1 [Eupeodes corollae]